ncbi:MAG: hypothetical protein KUG82_21980 [Pseudomonadales bacterium]|nr:hypothetical protein [Pseudomonadales bacterium]
MSDMNTLTNNYVATNTPSSSANPQEVTATRLGAQSGFSAPGVVDSKNKKNWYEAMASAWGDTLNQQANIITDLSDKIGNQGYDDPKTMALLTAQSMRMGFIANNASTSTSSVGKALETLARKG